MTELSRDIVLDLIPLYLAGEASESTIAAVERYLEHDEGLAEYIRSARDEREHAAETERMSADLEMRSMQKTRGALRRQRWLFALAIAFTAMGLAVRISFEDSSLPTARLVALDNPALIGFLVLAVICWIAYARVRRI